MKNILANGALIFPNPNHVDLKTGKGLRHFIERVGGNTGNCVIGELARRGIAGKFDNRYGEFNFEDNPETLHYKYDHVIIFAANWLSDSYVRNDYTNYVTWFEKCSVPVTMIGLGLQTSYDVSNHEGRANFLRIFDSSFLKLLTVIANKGGIAVRDELSAEILWQAGIRDVTPTGCPTWFSRGDKPLDIKKKVEFSFDMKLALAPDGLAYNKIQSLLGKFANSSMIYQSEKLLTPFTARRLTTSDGDFFCAATRPSTIILKRFNLDQKFNYRADWMRLFSTLEDWECFLKTCDLNFGCRIHSSILAIQNGIPAIIITHDTRTLAMANHFGIPSVSQKEFISNNFSLKKIYDEVDFNVMNDRYLKLYLIYKDFLEKHGLQAGDRTLYESLNPRTSYSPLSLLSIYKYKHENISALSQIYRACEAWTAFKSPQVALKRICNFFTGR